MANMLFANNCNTTLNGGITAVATSMVVTSATGFPSPTGSQYFYCTLADAATQTTIEIVKVTAVSGTTFTIVRGQDGTTGTVFASGDVVSLRLVRASLNDFPKLDEANTFTFAPTFNTALAVGSGGTGLTSLTANYIPYGNGTSAFQSSASLTFNGTVFSSLNSTGFTWAYPSTAGNIFGALGTGGSVFVNTPSLSSTFTSGLAIYGSYASSISTINISATGVASAGGYGSVLAFSTTNGQTITEAMRISVSSGVSIGNTTDPGAGNLSVNGVIKIGANQAVNGPAFSAYQSSAQTLSTGVTTKIQFQSEEFDTNNNFDSTTNYRFTPTVAGYYQVTGEIQLGVIATSVAVYIYKNGSAFKYGVSPTNTGGAGITALVYLNGSTDYVELYGNIGAGQALSASSIFTYFQAVMVRGA